MEVDRLVKQGNILKVSIVVKTNACIAHEKVSPQYIISDSVIFQVKAICATCKCGARHDIYMIFVKFTKIADDDEHTYALKLSSRAIGIVDALFTTNYSNTWHLLKEGYIGEIIDFSIQVDLSAPNNRSFSVLYEDIDFTDFQLKGKDGSVTMHRAILMTISPVFTRMLSGNWKEATEGNVDVPDTSKATLQHFKDYIYLHVLPEKGLEQLIALASYYMMPDLVEMCADKLTSSMTGENIDELLKFALIQNIPRLKWKIFDCILDGTINVIDIKKKDLELLKIQEKLIESEIGK